MKYHARTVNMPIATAEAMVGWLRACRCKVKHRALEDIERDIEAERGSGTYWAGEGVRFSSRKAWEDFRTRFC